MTRNILAGLLFLLLASSLSAMGSVPFSHSPSEEVIGGPLRVVGEALVYPNPFSLAADKNLVIQYRLSEDTDIDIFIVAVSGDIIKKLSFYSGAEGGSAGINKIRWNGRADDGTLIGNGIYVGTIVDRGGNNVLSKFKLAIND
ncbi:MAG: hypothetical protein WC500_04765 [Candidatus Margulisiibacteriota bacterium]